MTERRARLRAALPPQLSAGHALAAGWLALALVAAGIAACGGSEPAADDPTVAAWRKAGLAVSALSKTDPVPFAAKACQRAVVSDLDVVLCSYDDAAAATAAGARGLAAVGDATGAAPVRGTRMLVVVDRRKTDPQGKVMNAVLRGFTR